MKIALVAAVGLIVGIGAGTIVSAFHVKGTILEAHEQARADSLAAHPEAGMYADDGSVSVVLPPDEGTDGAAADAATATGADSAAVDAATDSSAAAPAPGGDAAAANPAGSAQAQVPETSPLNPDGAKKLSKIFGAMKPVDAAAILTQMSDEEVLAILVQMNGRLAGPIVSAFPPARAAELGSALLEARGGGL